MRGDPPICSIIIVSFNSSSCIEACLQPLLGMPEVELIVVDNHSEDGTVTTIHAYPSVKLIELPENIGFGSACNVGVSASSGHCILFLNPDAVASAQAIRALLNFFDDHPHAGIAGGCLIDPSGLPLQSIGDRPTLCRLIVEKPVEWVVKHLDPAGPVRRAIGRYMAKIRLPAEAERVVWVSGAALCCRRRVWEALGGFDEQFFLYYEDVDLCLRAADIDWEVWYVPDAVISHQSGASFSGNVVYQKQLYYASQRYFFSKHYGPAEVFLLSVAQRMYCWGQPSRLDD